MADTQHYTSMTQDKKKQTGNETLLSQSHTQTEKSCFQREIKPSAVHDTQEKNQNRRAENVNKGK
jgi:hypothetical protein